MCLDLALSMLDSAKSRHMFLDLKFWHNDPKSHYDFSISFSKKNQNLKLFKIMIILKA